MYIYTYILSNLNITVNIFLYKFLTQFSNIRSISRHLQSIIY